MTKEQFQALQGRMTDDIAFRERLKSAGDVECALEIAREAGFEVTQDDVSDYLSVNEQPLADDQVEDLSGGQHGQYPWKTDYYFPPSWP